MAENKIVRLCLFFILALAGKTFGCAQTGEEVRKHVIIAIDTRPNGFADMLHDSIFMTRKVTEILSEILCDSDYVSVIDYGLPLNAQSFDEFTTCTVGWDTYGHFRNTLPGAWDLIAHKQHHTGSLYSMLTGGKIYSFLRLNEIKDVKGKKAANKIYMLMLDDNQYNGNDDYNKEFQKYKENNGGSCLTEDVFRSTGIKVTRKYSFLWKKEEILTKKDGEKYYATLYEVVPTDRPSLPSAVVYPANLGLRRVKGGYEIDFEYTSALPSYKVKKLEIETVQDDSDNPDVEEIVMSEDFAGDKGHVNIFIDSKNLNSKKLNVVMRVWLEKEDDIYSGLVLSPYDNDNGNLTIKLELPLKDDAMILGLLPMPDGLWWWFPTDQSKAVLPWDIIVVLLFVVLVIFVSYKTYIWLTRYVPNNGDLHIINV